MSEERNAGEPTTDYAGAVREAIGIDWRILGVTYVYLVAAMVTSAWLVRITGFDSRLGVLGVSVALGVFWTAYYAFAIHPKVVNYAVEAD